jgi:hypothetical protein
VRADVLRSGTRPEHRPPQSCRKIKLFDADTDDAMAEADETL